VLNSKRDKKNLPVLTSEFNSGRMQCNLKTVSKSTVARAFTAAKMCGCVIPKKPLLRKENVEKRLQFLL
jgi:hypothetical protein